MAAEKTIHNLGPFWATFYGRSLKAFGVNIPATKFSYAGSIGLTFGINGISIGICLTRHEWAEERFFEGVAITRRHGISRTGVRDGVPFGLAAFGRIVPGSEGMP